MNNIIDLLKDFKDLLNWQVITLIILFMVRRHLGLVFQGLNGLLNRTTKIIVNGKSLTVEAAEAIIQEQKEKIEEKNKELRETTKELGDYQKGAIQVLPRKLVSENLERLEPIMRTMGMEEMLSKKLKNSKHNPDDPQKGKWGGHSIVADKKLSATVVPLENSPDLFKVILTVESSDKNRFLGKVTFYLHPTFINAVRTVESENGLAQLHLIAYGAFTVGIETEDGTKLELDLAEDMSFPDVFRNR